MSLFDAGLSVWPLVMSAESNCGGKGICGTASVSWEERSCMAWEEGGCAACVSLEMGGRFSFVWPSVLSKESLTTSSET